MKRIFILCFILFANQLFAQNPNWQQEVNSVINVELDVETNQLNGEITMEYINHSPNELNEIYFHIYPNAYSNNQTAFSKQQIQQGKKQFYFSDESEKGSISEFNFFVDGIGTQIQQFNNQVDIAVLPLNEPLNSGDTITVQTPFVVKLPKLWSRMGVKKGVYHITQWYPKPAVYDKNGWHAMPYLDQGEFYNEFGTYEVNITVPSNMVVAATGELQTKDEVEWLSKLSTATKQGIENSYTFTEANLTKQRQGTKTIQYKQNNVHDFAWFASTDFLLLEDVVNIQEEPKTLQSFFTEENVFTWENANKYLTLGMQFYSEKIGQYPYSNYKAIGADISTGGGMEYPMVTVVRNYQNDLALKKVLVHELGHSWFQGVLGSNEREFAWLDEGINSFYEEFALANEVGVKELDFETTSKYLPAMNSLHLDQPIQYEAEKYHAMNYGMNVYGEGAKAMNYLREYLGDEKFDKGMQRYFNTWKFNHPYPEDLQNSFDNPEQLDFFFKDIVVDNKEIDYALKSVKNGEAVIENKGEIAAPFTLDIVDENNEIIQTTWIDGFSGTKTIPLNYNGSYKKVEIFHRPVFTETDRSNNARTAKNKSANKLQVLTPFTSVSNLEDFVGSHERKQLYISPMLGWNNYDKLMIGAGFSNTAFLKKPFEYQIIPMFATNTKDIVDLADFKYHIKPTSKVINEITPFLRTRRFNYNEEKYELDYFRNEVGATFDFSNNKAEPNNIRKQLNANVVGNTIKPIPIYNTTTNTYEEQDYNTTLFYNVNYTRVNARKINPNSLNVGAQLHESFSKVYGEYKYKYEFEKPKQYFKLRAFGGVVASSKDEMPFAANFSAIGRNGMNDYDFSNLYFYREDATSFLNNAWTEADGGLKVMQDFAQIADIYGDTMLALNGEITAPFELPLGRLLAYGDVAMFHKAFTTDNKESSMLYDAGLSYQLGGGLFQLYYPLLLSNEFKPDNDIQKLEFKDKLVFRMNFNPLDMKQRVRNRFK